MNSDLINNYPHAAAVQKVLEDRMYVDADEFEGELGLVTAAYATECGCINDEVWDLEDIEQSIIRKFKYAYIGVMELLGYESLDYDVVVEPSWEDTTTVVVIIDDRVVHKEHTKAWHFGGGNLDEVEQEFQYLADTLARRTKELYGP